MYVHTYIYDPYINFARGGIFSKFFEKICTSIYVCISYIRVTRTYIRISYIRVSYIRVPLHTCKSYIRISYIRISYIRISYIRVSCATRARSFKNYICMYIHTYTDPYINFVRGGIFSKFLKKFARTHTYVYM